MKIKELLSKSYVRRVTLFLSVFMLAQLFITFGMFYSFQRSTDRQRDELSSNMISTLDDTVARSIRQAEADLESLMAANIDIRILSGNRENARVTVANSLSNLLNTFIAATRTTDAYIIYNPQNDIFLLSRSSRVAYGELEPLRQFAEALAPAYSQMEGDWHVADLKGTHYLLRLYHYYGCYFIAAFHINTFFSIISYDKLFRSDACAVLSGANADILAVTGDCPLPESLTVLADLPGGYYVNTRALSYGGLRASYICPQNRGVDADILTACLAAVCLTTLILLVAFLFYLQQEIFAPIGELSKTTNVIKQGDYTRRAELVCRSPELQELAGSINSMIGTIIHQRIASYEGAIKEKNLELKYLQMQLRPHHFLNTLSTISSLSYLGDNERIRRFVDLYSKDARYLFSASLQLVPLEEEIRHIQDYIDCQAILYPDCVFSFIDIQPEVGSWPIPQMVLHALVENIYKHAVSLDSFVSFFIRASHQTDHQEAFLELVIEDDGQGFPEDVIAQVNCSDALETSTATPRIGLMNVSQTLCLFYDRPHLMELRNKDDHGSIIRLRIPQSPREAPDSSARERRDKAHADPDR